MTASQFREWRVFFDLEPFGEERDDYRFASICQALWTIARAPRSQMPIENFLVNYGDGVPRTVQPEQSLDHQERLIDMWIAGSNAIFSKKRAS